MGLYSTQSLASRFFWPDKKKKSLEFIYCVVHINILFLLMLRNTPYFENTTICIYIFLLDCPTWIIVSLGLLWRKMMLILFNKYFLWADVLTSPTGVQVVCTSLISLSFQYQYIVIILYPLGRNLLSSMCKIYILHILHVLHI